MDVSICYLCLVFLFLKNELTHNRSSWNNEFPHDPLSPNAYKDELHFGDLVSMTIVDVFETDCDGKLLSYCPTFDNRNITKTDPRVENIRKSSSKFKKNIDIVAKSRTAAKVNQVSEDSL